MELTLGGWFAADQQVLPAGIFRPPGARSGRVGVMMLAGRFLRRRDTVQSRGVHGAVTLILAMGMPVLLVLSAGLAPMLDRGLNRGKPARRPV